MKKIPRGMINRKKAIMLLLGLILVSATVWAGITTNGPTADSGSWTDGNKSYLSDNSSAYTKGKGEHIYSGYDFDGLPDYCVSEVEVGIEYYAAGNDKIRVWVSWDGGSNWSSLYYTTTLKTVDNDTPEWFNFTSVTSWDRLNLSDMNFRVKVKHIVAGGPEFVYLDWIPVRVTHYPCELTDYWIIENVNATHRNYTMDAEGLYDFYEALDPYEVGDYVTVIWNNTKVGNPSDPPNLLVEYVHENGSSLELMENPMEAFPVLEWDVNHLIFPIEDGVTASTVYVYFANDATSLHNESGTYKRWPDGPPRDAGSDTYAVGIPYGLAAIYNDDGSITLTWNGGAELYDIYITNNYTAGFNLSNPYANTSNTSWTDEDAPLYSQRYYRIGASGGGVSNETVGKFDIELHSGLNLVSLPLIPANNSIKEVLHQNASNYNITEIYNPKPSGDYMVSTFYSSNSPGYWWSPENFTTLDNDKGYWFKLSQDYNFTLVGEVPISNRSVNLSAGMNLVGWTSLEERKLWNAANQSASDYNVTEIYSLKPSGDYMVSTFYSDNTPDYWWSPDSFNSLSSGKGYRFEVEQAWIWSYAS